MNFHSIYRISFYLMLFLATLVLNIDSTDANQIALLYPLMMVVICAVSYFLVDGGPRIGLSNTAANVLGLCSPILVYLEIKYDENLLMLALGHWIVYLQFIKLLRVKTTQDEWVLLITALVQVIIGGVISQSDVVGMALLSWSLCSIWVLALFTLRRESARGKPSPGTTIVPEPDDQAPYPKLISLSFFLASVRVAAMTLALGGFIFLVMPRQNTMGTSIKGDSLGKHLTGFDDEVQLGQLGEILENDSVVMTIEVSDQDGKVVRFDDEPLWRGVGMVGYDRGRWRKQKPKSSDFSLYLPGRPRETRWIRQQIKLEPTDNPVLFGLRPILYAESTNKRFAPEFSEIDGSIYRGDNRPVSLEYKVISSKNREQGQPQERFPSTQMVKNLLAIEPSLKATLKPIAEQVVKDIDPLDYVARGKKLESFLRDSEQFHYTLRMDVVDPTIDPVADFLLNRKEGHCEYFASALTLLLRSIDIPARLINGFKGGDYNDIAAVFSVRQKHAHSWCEVLKSAKRGHPDEPPIWFTLDPTPGAAREESIAKVGGLTFGTRQFTDFVRYLWVFYIVGFNFERQQKFLYEPIRMLIHEAANGFEMMGRAFRAVADWLFHFPSVSSFISFRGFLVTFGSLTLLLLGLRLSWHLTHRYRRARRKAHADRSALAVGVLFYRRLVGLLDDFGLERSEWETPREFARRAASFLAGNGLGHDSVADVPPLVVEAYYRIRFGHQEIESESLNLVESRLDALEARLHPSTN